MGGYTRRQILGYTKYLVGLIVPPEFSLLTSLNPIEDIHLEKKVRLEYWLDKLPIKGKNPRDSFKVGTILGDLGRAEIYVESNSREYIGAIVMTVPSLDFFRVHMSKGLVKNGLYIPQTTIRVVNNFGKNFSHSVIRYDQEDRTATYNEDYKNRKTGKIMGFRNFRIVAANTMPEGKHFDDIISGLEGIKRELPYAGFAVIRQISDENSNPRLDEVVVELSDEKSESGLILQADLSTLLGNSEGTNILIGHVNSEGSPVKGSITDVYLWFDLLIERVSPEFSRGGKIVQR